MKITKKILSLILVVIMCFSTASMAIAAEPSANGDDKIVANFYIYVMETDIHPIGHMWVYMENLTNKPMKVGYYTIPAKKGMSVGVFARKDGFGIYYNVEAYTQTVYGMENQYCLKDQLTADKVQDVSDALIDAANHWDPIFNCMYFAFKIWNAGCSRGKRLLHLVWPPLGTLQIKLKTPLREVQMKGVTMDQAYRQVGSGRNGRLVPATLKSLGRI
ncbi:MAG: hypothetical protein J6V06_06730 [Clostridia bacterium]|nr:hypothetical protein [Clostridia bacterium]MBO7319693.1 hypothetical protein [Clostridia bacterium]